MGVIKNLKVENKNSSDIEGFIEDLENTVNSITSVSYTGNETLDSILNIKGRRAKALDIYREFSLIAGLVVLAVPGFKLLNHNWYVYLTETMPGKIVVAIAYLVTFFVIS